MFQVATSLPATPANLEERSVVSVCPRALGGCSSRDSENHNLEETGGRRFPLWFSEPAEPNATARSQCCLRSDRIGNRGGASVPCGTQRPLTPFQPTLCPPPTATLRGSHGDTSWESRSARLVITWRPHSPRPGAGDKEVDSRRQPGHVHQLEADPGQTQSLALCQMIHYRAPPSMASPSLPLRPLRPLLLPSPQSRFL